MLRSAPLHGMSLFRQSDQAFFQVFRYLVFPFNRQLRARPPCPKPHMDPLDYFFRAWRVGKGLCEHPQPDLPDRRFRSHHRWKNATKLQTQLRQEVTWARLSFLRLPGFSKRKPQFCGRRPGFSQKEAAHFVGPYKKEAERKATNHCSPVPDLWEQGGELPTSLPLSQAVPLG